MCVLRYVSYVGVLEHTKHYDFDKQPIKKLIDEHQEFMDNLSSRQPEIDAVCKPMRPKSTAPSSRKTSKIGRPG